MSSVAALVVDKCVEERERKYSVCVRWMILISANDVTTLTGNDFMIDEELTI